MIGTLQIANTFVVLAVLHLLLLGDVCCAATKEACSVHMNSTNSMNAPSNCILNKKKSFNKKLDNFDFRIAYSTDASTHEMKQKKKIDSWSE